MSNIIKNLSIPINFNIFLQLYLHLQYLQNSKTRELFKKISLEINNQERYREIEEKKDGFAINSEKSNANVTELKNINSMHDETEFNHSGKVYFYDQSYDPEFPYLTPASSTSLLSYDFGQTSDHIDKIQVSLIRKLRFYVFFKQLLLKY